MPTTVEAGFPKLNAPFWLGVVAPAGTPPDIIDKLNAAFRESLAPAETRARLAHLGAEIKIGTPAEFGKMLAERARAMDRRGEGRQHQGGMKFMSEEQMVTYELEGEIALVGLNRPDKRNCFNPT